MRNCSDFRPLPHADFAGYDLRGDPFQEQRFSGK